MADGLCRNRKLTNERRRVAERHPGQINEIAARDQPSDSHIVTSAPLQVRDKRHRRSSVGRRTGGPDRLPPLAELGKHTARSTDVGALAANPHDVGQGRESPEVAT